MWGGLYYYQMYINDIYAKLERIELLYPCTLCTFDILIRNLDEGLIRFVDDTYTAKMGYSKHLEDGINIQKDI